MPASPPVFDRRGQLTNISYRIVALRKMKLSTAPRDPALIRSRFMKGLGTVSSAGLEI